MLGAMSALAGFISRLPKAELHVHHVGSASPRIVSELAQRHPGKVPSDPALLADFFAFRDFAHFIEVYLAVVDLIRTPEDVRLLTYEVAREMAEVQQVRYAELTCTPYTSVAVGVPIEGYTEAIEDARVAAEKDFGIVLRWIYDIPGESGLPAADDTLDYALNHAPDGLIGFGLGGPEVGVPRPQFKPHFDAARAAGLRSLPHAGETTGPETVWDALRHLGAERIGHGTSSAQDPALLAHLAEHQIPLEVCPSSNIATRAVATLDEHPLPRLPRRRCRRDDQQRRPTHVRHLAEPGVRDRRRPPRPRRGRRRRPGPHRRPGLLRPRRRQGPDPRGDRRGATPLVEERAPASVSKRPRT